MSLSHLRRNQFFARLNRRNQSLARLRQTICEKLRPQMSHARMAEPPQIERLEDRRLLSVGVGLTGTVATFTGDGSNDNLLLEVTGGGLIEYSTNGGTSWSTDLDTGTAGTQTLLASAATGIAVNLGGGDDSLTLDFSGGSDRENVGLWFAIRLKAFPQTPIGLKQTYSRPRFGPAPAASHTAFVD